MHIDDAWGLTHWSHRLSTWADLWRPDGNTFPQYDLAWRRFQADLTSGFIRWQAEIAREYTSAGQFVTTCLAYSRPAVEDDTLTAALDVTAANLYYAMQDGLARPGEPVPAGQRPRLGLHRGASRCISGPIAPTHRGRPRSW